MFHTWQHSGGEWTRPYTIYCAPLTAHSGEASVPWILNMHAHTPVTCSVFLVGTASSSVLPSRRGDLDSLRGDLETRRGGDREDLDRLLGERDMGLGLPRLGERDRPLLGDRDLPRANLGGDGDLRGDLELRRLLGDHLPHLSSLGGGSAGGGGPPRHSPKRMGGPTSGGGPLRLNSGGGSLSPGGGSKWADPDGGGGLWPYGG